MTTELQRAVCTLVAAARAAHPSCPGWQLTMNPETYALIDPELTAPGTAEQSSGSFYDGCRIWSAPTWANTVVCSPLVAPGTWELPDEYYLDLRDKSISTLPPLQTRLIPATDAADR